MNFNEVNKNIDYSKTSINDRKQIVENILNQARFEEYFDEDYKVNLNSTDNLSEQNLACTTLEKLANYLLNSDEVKEDKRSCDFEYKFYSDEESFRKAIVKEPKLDSMAEGTEKENVIHFLKKENRNFKKTKNQRISKKDINRDDELGNVLRSYNEYLKIVTKELGNFENSKLSRFQLSNISGSVKDDMIRCKDILLGVFGYKTNSEESTHIDWEQIDFSNYNHARALLYMPLNYSKDEDLKYIIEDFNKLYIKAKPTRLQKQIVHLMRDENMRLTEIGNELNIPRQNVDKNIKMLVKRINKIAERKCKGD